MPTARISEEARRVLRQLSQESSESMQSVLEKAIEAYRRWRFLQDANRAFAALRRDPKAWKEEQAEREAWDITLADHLED